MPTLTSDLRPLTSAPIGERIWIEGRPARLRLTPFAPYEGIRWSIASVIPEQAFLADVQAVQRRAIAMGVIAAVGALVLGLVLSRSISRPIVRLRSHARAIGEGDFDTRLTISAARELRELADDLNRMASGLKERMELRQSLELATEVQQSLLPHAPPKLPGLDIAGHSKYCDTTGGDYFDFIDVAALPRKQTLVAVGDVTGHGIASALLMATARAALRAIALSDDSLATLMTRVNDVLARDARHNRFMTMHLLVVDPEAGSLRYASAGHDPPIIYSPASDAFRDIEGGDIPLGIMPDVTYQEYRADGIEPASVIVIGTDGIWEAPNQQGEHFGKARLRETIRANARQNAEGISAAIDRALAEFCERDRYPDDVTFVVVKMAPDEMNHRDTEAQRER